MALITENIPTQNFEIVKNEIAFILQEEINNQIDFNQYDLSVDIYLDRKNPVSNSEDAVIDIYLATGEYSEYTTLTSEGSYIFNIDIYTNTQNENKNSSSVLDLIYGWVRYILSHPEYRMLGLGRGIIAGTYVKGFTSQEKLLIGDSDFFSVKSVQFECRVKEQQQGAQGVNLVSNFLDYKICLTDKGYKVQSNF